MAEFFSRDQLADCMDEIKAVCSSPALDAVPWMNLKHPVHPVQEDLIRSVPPIETLKAEHPARAVGRAAWGFLYAFWLAFQLVRIRWSFRATLKELKGRSYEVVAKSWHFSGKEASGADFYYGDLQDRLSQQGVRMLLLSGDVQGMLWRWTPHLRRTAVSSNRLPEWVLVPWSAPWQVVWTQWRAWRKLQRFAEQTDRVLSRRVALRAGRDLLSHRLIAIGLYRWVAREGIRLWKPKAWLTLYEGHGWEQILWRGVRETDPECKVVGYQHTILPPYLSALLRSSRTPGARLRPDRVLCLGPRSKRLMEPSHPGSILNVFGTFRLAGPDSQPLREPAPSRKSVIVLPEGILEEARILFEAALAAAQRSPDLKFIFRSHPRLPFETVQPLLSLNAGRITNVEISGGKPMEEDLARASAILYRGSSSVLYAVLAGLKPVYLHQQGLREIDPLSGLEVWRERIASWQELGPRLKDFERAGPEQITRDWRRAVQYVQEYAVGVDENSIQVLLDTLGHARSAIELKELRAVG